MPSTSHSLISYLRAVAGVWRDDPRDDVELLARFAEGSDESAFKVLVGRHGPLVWRTCRRILGDTPDAEDAFQVTFLALARKAGRFPIRSLADWLYQVARRAALNTCVSIRRRQNMQQRLRAVTKPEVGGEDSQAELNAVLDEELADLPERLRVPLVLHYLEGKTQDEVARILGSSRSAVRRRLAQGEAILRERLERNGLSVGLASIAVLLGGTVTAPGVPARLIGSTAQAAVAFRSGTFTGGAAEVARAVLGTLPTSMGTTIMRKSLWIVLACSLGLGGAGLITCHALSVRPDELGEADPAAMQAPNQPGADGRAAARVDCLGNPLPVHALARMGTTRLWQPHAGAGFLAFSPDGKMLASSVDRVTVCLWDTATGKEIHRLTTEPLKKKYDVGWLPPFDSLGFSPDGKTLVALNWAQTACFWDVATGKFLRMQEYRGPWRNNVQSFLMVLSPDGKMLGFGDFASGESRRAFVWDLATGKDICQLNELKKRFYSINVKAFSPDGKTLATVANEAKEKEQKIVSSCISLWDIATGKEIRQLTQTREVNNDVGDGGVHGMAFSRDGKTFISTDDRQICVWEIATGKKIHRLEKSWKNPLMLSLCPDGKILSGGQEEGHLWDVATGKEIRSFAWEQATTAVLSPDGKTLAVADRTGAIRLWVVATGKEIGPRKGYRGRIQSVAYSPDGKTLASLSGEEREDETVRLWEVSTGKEIRQLAKGSRSFAYSPDGKTLASTMDGGVLHLWDIATDKGIRQFNTGGVWRSSATFSPDGKKLATMIGSHEKVHLWVLETATGKTIYSLPTEANDSGYSYGAKLIAFSPDGRMLAAPGKNGTISLWEMATGQFLGQLGQPHQRVSREAEVVVRFLAFSPDGRILATSSARDEKIRLWEVVSGKEIWQLGALKNAGLQNGCTLAFSPDGRILATAAQGNGVNLHIDPKVHLWEIASGKEIGQLIGHQAPVQTIAFSLDGKTMASGSDDLTCLVWDLTPFAGQLKPVPASPLPAKALSKEQLEATWADLAKEPAKAYVAFGALQAVPTQAISLLQARLRPVAPLADSQQLKRWIADLDDNNFTVRSKAQQEIVKLGEPAIFALRQALKGQPSVEARRRLKDLLAELEPQEEVVVSPERLRELRAVHMLEFIGTAEAQQVLQAMAKGVAEARLTREAQAALARLAKRSIAKP